MVINEAQLLEDTMEFLGEVMPAAFGVFLLNQGYGPDADITAIGLIRNLAKQLRDAEFANVLIADDELTPLGDGAPTQLVRAA